MANKYTDIIIFGPTGDIGGHAALEASKRGAKVWLAMRDPSKPISAIPSDVEKSGAFTRVQADLTDPITVAKAVKESGTKAAYVYLVFTPDFLRGSLQAMRDAGIEYIVFLSTFTVKHDVDIRTIQEDDSIPYAHAQVEIAVEEVGFPYFTTLRPARFASNYLRMFVDRSSKPPRANFVYGDSLADNIVPEDIGAVAGAVLVERPHSLNAPGKEVIYLCGPEVKTSEEWWGMIKEISGRDDLDVTPSSEDEFIARLIKAGTPPFVADYLNRTTAAMREPSKAYPESMYKPAVDNMRKYLGRHQQNGNSLLATFWDFSTLVQVKKVPQAQVHK